MKSQSSSRTSRRRRPRSTAAEILGVFLDSPAGQQLGDLLRYSLAKLFGLEAGGEAFDNLCREARAAAGQYSEHHSDSESSPYRVLGLDSAAEEDVVKQVYRTLAKRYHPDNGKTPDGVKMRMLNTAYEEICRQRGWAK